MRHRSVPSHPLTRLLLALLLAAAALPASADRGCLGDPLLTGRTCSEVECVALQANVNSACKNPAPRSCNSISGCGALRFEKGRWLACANARDIINARCWGGGDPGHQQASAQAWQNVGNCTIRMRLPEPIGCADPCPFNASAAGATAGEQIASALGLPAR
jgi:hypothetical protein